jgi:DNA replication protein DnaC
MNQSRDIKADLTQSLKTLHLPTIRQCYEEVARQAEREQLSYERYLHEVVQRECEDRLENRTAKMLRESQLPLEKSLEAFDTRRLPPKAARQMRTLLDGGFLERTENVLVFGNPGSGKTHMLQAVGQQLIRRDHRIFFTTCEMLVQELLIAKRDLKLSKLIKKYARYEGMIIDDLGYIRQTREEMEVVFTLLAERYERGSVLLTSNLPFSKWEGIFKDPMTTAAAIDRLSTTASSWNSIFPASGWNRQKATLRYEVPSPLLCNIAEQLPVRHGIGLTFVAQITQHDQVVCERINAEASQIVLTSTPIAQPAILGWHRVELPHVHTLNK